MTQRLTVFARDQDLDRILPSWLIRGFGIAFLAGVLWAAFNVFIEIDRQIDRHSRAQSDNVTWIVTQLEVDVLKLENALLRARGNPDSDSLHEVRKWFDILYSRADVIADDDKTADLSITQGAVWDNISGPQGFLARNIPVMDGPDPALQAALPDLAAQVSDLRSRLRTAILTSVHQTSDRSDAMRLELRTTLQRFAAISLGFFAVFAGLAFLLFVQGLSRQQHADMLESAVSTLQTTINAARSSVLILDGRMRVVGWNRAGAALMRLAEADTGRRSITSIAATDEDAERLRTAIRLVIDSNDPAEPLETTLALTCMGPEGDRFPAEVSLALARDPKGLALVIAFVRDLSDQVEREETLRQARNLARKGDEAKSRFLAVMSHEMRTPLNGLLAASELLSRTTTLDDRQRWLTGIIQSCGKSTLEQVNNVLELTRLDASGGKGYPSSDFDPLSTLQEIIDQSRADAALRSNRLVLSPVEGVVRRVHGQRQLFQRILSNLLGNAIKFTEGGTITVRVLAETGPGPSQHSLRVSVVDTGIGIADEDLDRIFRNFETLDASYARVSEGSGLGLGIAKLAAEALGGRITVQSRLGQGSTFSLFITLPLAAEAQPEEAVPRPAAEPRSILVVDDNALNRRLLVELLSLQGHGVETAEDGQEAVEIAQKRRFDLILMDVMMPRMDGLQATRLIRSQGECRDVPIVAVTANANPDRIAEFRDCGMDDVLTKPVDLAMLQRALSPGAKFGPAPRQKSLIPASAPPILPTPAPTSKGAAMMTDQALLDEGTFSDLEGQLGRDFISRMTTKFKAEAEAAIVELRRTEASGDHPGAASLAHRTAGAAATLGLRGLHSALITFENEMKAGKTDKAAALLADIASAQNRTFDLLRERGILA